MITEYALYQVTLISVCAELSELVVRGERKVRLNLRMRGAVGVRGRIFAMSEP